MSEEQLQEHVHEGGGSKWHRKLIIALMIIVGVSVAARVVLAKDKPQHEATEAKGGDGENPLGPARLVADDGTEPAQGEVKEPTTTEKVLPFVTEGGIAMIIGTMLGMATRMVAKIAIFLFAIFFIALQFMSYKGWVDVNWSSMFAWVKDFVLNISSDEGLGGIVKHKLPSAGSLGLGYYLGLKKGD